MGVYPRAAADDVGSGRGRDAPVPRSWRRRFGVWPRCYAAARHLSRSGHVLVAGVPAARGARCADRGMTSTRATTTAALVAGLAAVSCVSSTATDVPRELPVGQQYSFTCGRWSPGSPAVDRALFDLRLWQDGIESGPAPAFVEAIEAAGGRIVYTFHGPMLRAELDPQAVPALASARVLNAANTVADSDVHDVTLGCVAEPQSQRRGLGSRAGARWSDHA